ncbi:hypothetical protein B0H11DRAFT_1974897 [Mycena galericulata]|nr:hypothetical protein B0H11DRAFT_1974897 [Mycena galericulata]
MAIIQCDSCGTTQAFYEFQRPIVRDAQGRITREGGWTFDPATGRCIGDASDARGSGEPYAHRCFGCHQRYGWVYSSEPPPMSTWTPQAAQLAAHEAAAVDRGLEPEPEYVWSVRRKSCQCRGRCQLRGGGIGGCGCASSGRACSVMCGCGGRGEDGQCLSPYTPPRDADPGAKRCSCTSGCQVDVGRIGSSCGCASLSVGCSERCGCQGNCRNGLRP